MHLYSYWLIILLHVHVLKRCMGYNCVKHKVRSNDYSYKLIQEKCNWIHGCKPNVKTFPTIRRFKNQEVEYCPENIHVNEIIEICCQEPSNSQPKPPPSGSCNLYRKVNNGDTIYFTIDDGPSRSSRKHLLNAFRRVNAHVTFFDSGYQVCHDVDNNMCASWAYQSNIQLLADTVKAGHTLGSHSDFHYYDKSKDQCNYQKMKPKVRPLSRWKKCGNKPIQDMVQGAHQLESALMHPSIKWTQLEELLKQKAIDTIWTYARLPCSDIWRTRGGIFETNLPGINDWKEKNLRKNIANEMYGGNVRCRPVKYSGKPWELYGFAAAIEWHGHTILNKGEKCRMARLIEKQMDNQKNPRKRGKVVLLTHDYHFNNAEKANVFGELIHEMRSKGYKIGTIDRYHV